MRLSWLLGGLLSACLTPSLQPCGDLLCAVGAICVADTVCATQEQLAACFGVAPDGACQTSGGAGHCVAGVCVGNVCGDGLVTGNEVCDGDDIAVTCQDFGFYGGTISCAASCTADRTSCAGRCGDEVVQSEFDEQCDTNPPAEGCVFFGQDFGLLTCNAFCAPAISNDCGRYGWDELLPATTAYTDAAVSSHGAIGLHDSSVDVLWNGVMSTRANPGWTRVAPGANAFAAVGPSSIGWFDGTWHELPFGNTSTWLALSDDDHLFAGTNAPCAVSEVDLAAGTSAALPAPPSTECGSAVAFGQDELYIAQGLGGVRAWTGTGWITTSASAASVIVRAGPRRFAAVSQTTTRFIDVSQAPVNVGPTQFGSITDGLAFDVDGNELRATVIGDGTPPAYAFRAHGALFGLEGQLPEAQQAIASSADGRIATFGNGVFAMHAFAVAAELPISTAIRDVHLADDGVILCGSNIFISGVNGFAQRPYTAVNGTCIEVTGSALGAHYVVSASQGLLGYNAGNNTYQQLLATPVTSVAGDFTQLWTANGNELIGIAGGGAPASEFLPVGCVATKVGMSAMRRFAAVGVCNGKLAVFDRPTAWSLLATTQLDADAIAPLQLVISADDTIFVGYATNVYRLDGTSLTLVGSGPHFDAVSHDDLFIDQGSDTVLHVTPTRSQELRLASGPFVASATHLFSWDRLGRRLYGIARATNVPNGP